MAFGRKKSGEDDLLDAEVVRPDGGFGGGYPGFTPGDFEEDAPVKERRGRRRKKGSEAEEELDGFADSGADALEGTAPQTQFDFLEGTWVYTQKVTRTRRVATATSAVIVLLVLGVGASAYIGARSAAAATEREQQRLRDVTTELSQESRVGYSQEELAAHLTQRRTDIFVAVGSEANYRGVIEEISARAAAAGVRLQSISFQPAPPAAVAAVPGAPAAPPVSVVISVEGQGFPSVISWIDETDNIKGITGANTVPSGSPQGTFSITTTAALSPAAASPRVAALIPSLLLPNEDPATVSVTPVAPAPDGATPAPGGSGLPSPGGAS